MVEIEFISIHFGIPIQIERGFVDCVNLLLVGKLKWVYGFTKMGMNQYQYFECLEHKVHVECKRW